jgi:hypothetical protein
MPEPFIPRHWLPCPRPAPGTELRVSGVGRVDAGRAWWYDLEPDRRLQSVETPTGEVWMESIRLACVDCGLPVPHGEAAVSFASLGAVVCGACRLKRRESP